MSFKKVLFYSVAVEVFVKIRNGCSIKDLLEYEGNSGCKDQKYYYISRYFWALKLLQVFERNKLVKRLSFEESKSVFAKKGGRPTKRIILTKKGLKVQKLFKAMLKQMEGL